MNMTPPDPICRFCEDWCSGTCEGARMIRDQFNEQLVKARKLLASAKESAKDLEVQLHEANKRIEDARKLVNEITDLIKRTPF